MQVHHRDNDVLIRHDPENDTERERQYVQFNQLCAVMDLFYLRDL